MRNNIYIIIAAYNEEKSIASVIESLLSCAEKIIIVNDCSTDRTLAEIPKNSKVVVLNHIINLGQGAALQTGFEYARNAGADIAITFDADGQFDASDIKRSIKPIVNGEVDVVLGSRFLGKIHGLPYLRKLTLKIGIIFTYIFSDIKLSDTHNGFRIFNRKALNLINITHNRMAHASEIIDEIIKNKLTYKEMPITVRYTKYSKGKGQSSLNSINIVAELISSKLK